MTESLIHDDNNNALLECVPYQRTLEYITVIVTLVSREKVLHVECCEYSNTYLYNGLSMWLCWTGDCHMHPHLVPEVILF